MRPMPLYEVSLGAWAFIVIVGFRLYGFYLVPAIIGGVAGSAWIYFSTERQLKGLEKNGEWKPRSRYQLLAIIGVIVFVLAFSLLTINALASSNLALIVQAYSFSALLLISSHASYIVLFLSWERKHKKQIYYDGWFLGRIFAYEKPKPLPPPQPPPPDL